MKRCCSISVIQSSQHLSFYHGTHDGEGQVNQTHLYADISHPIKFMSVFSFLSVSEIFLFGLFPYAGRRSLQRVKPGLLTGFGFFFTSHGPPWVSDSGVSGTVTWVQLISFCCGSVPVFKFPCGY